MTEQDFIDYMARYGTHVQHIYGDDIIQKKIHLTPYSSNSTYFPQISGGKRYHMEFEINGVKSSIKDCVELIKRYERNKKIDSILL